MSPNVVDAESTVSGTQTTIPANIRQTLDIDDGDRLRWILDDSGELRIEVVSRGSRTFAEFEGYDGEVDTNSMDEHDAWGVE